MTTRELLHSEIDSLNEQQLKALQKIVQEFIEQAQTTPSDLKHGKGWSQTLINQTCGQWEGELLTRPIQPEYNTRDELI